MGTDFYHNPPDVPEKPQPFCAWTLDDEYWESDCHHDFYLDGTPTENSMKYCCFCGKPIVERIEGRDGE